MADLTICVDEAKITGNNFQGVTVELHGVDWYDIPGQLNDDQIEELLNSMDFDYIEDYVKRNKI